jgi:hypothetical protein
MKKIALCVGINAYNGAPLAGCVNDALAWMTLLDGLGYDVVTLLDEDATRDTIVKELRAAVSELHWGDRFVFTFSGHGSWMLDTNGDEPDGRDEVLVTHDWSNSGYISDDEIGAIADERRIGSRMTIISDSCHSGTVARLVGPYGLDRSAVHYGNEVKRRYFPMEMLRRRLPIAERKSRALRVKADPVLLSGCGDLEYSYDAHINGTPQGAMTWAATSTWQPNLTMSAWHKRIRSLLPSQNYPQSPELHATKSQRRWTL